MPPAQLFLGRNIRTRLHLVRTEPIETRIKEKQQSEFLPTYRSFDLADRVYFLSGNPAMKEWVYGTIHAEYKYCSASISNRYFRLRICRNAATALRNIIERLLTRFDD